MYYKITEEIHFEELSNGSYVIHEINTDTWQRLSELEQALIEEQGGRTRTSNKRPGQRILYCVDFIKYTSGDFHFHRELKKAYRNYRIEELLFQ
jgi:hypothetical protein